MSYSRDRNGRWHGPNGRFVSAATVAAAGYGGGNSSSSSRSSLSSGYSSYAGTSSRSGSASSRSACLSSAYVGDNTVSSLSGLYQDRTGRWHGSDGKFVSKATVAAAGYGAGNSSSSSWSSLLSDYSSYAGTSFRSGSASSRPVCSSSAYVGANTISSAPSSAARSSTAAKSAAKSSSAAGTAYGSFCQDRNGRWHGPDGKFVSHAAVAAAGQSDSSSDPRSYSSLSDTASARKKQPPILSSNGSFYQDRNGRWHGPDGKFVSHAAVAAAGQSNSSSGPRSSSSLSDTATARKKQPPNRSSNGSFYQDRNGRWHGPDGKFVSLANIFGVSQEGDKPTKNEKANFRCRKAGKETRSSPYYQDATGRWHGPNGQFVSKTAVEAYYGTTTLEPECNSCDPLASARTAQKGVLNRNSLFDMLCRRPENEISEESDTTEDEEEGTSLADTSSPPRLENEYSEESDTSEDNDEGHGFVLTSPSGVTWSVPLSFARDLKDKSSWKPQVSPTFKLHGLVWMLRLEAPGYLSLQGENGNHRPQLGSGGWIAAEVSFTLAVIGSMDSPQVATRVAANLGGCSGDAWMRVRCPPLPDGSALLVAHAALEAPARGVAKDLHRLLTLGACSDIMLKVKGGASLQAHRAVLRGRSRVMAHLLEDRADSSVLRVPDLPASAARPLLQYLYSGVAPAAHTLAADPRLAVDLHCAAVCFEVPELAKVTRASLSRESPAEPELVVDLLRSLCDYAAAPALLLGAEGDWIASLASIELLKTDLWLDFLRDCREEAVAVMRKIVRRDAGQQAPPASPHHGAVAACCPSSALWCCAPAAGASTLRSPPLAGARRSWQLCWSGDTLSVALLSPIYDDGEDREDAVQGVTIVVLADCKVLFKTIEVDLAMGGGSWQDCNMPQDQKSFAIYVHFFVQSQPDHQQCLRNDLETMLADETGMDVELESSQEADQPGLLAHKAVLVSRAEFFRAMFASGMQEEQTGKVRLPFPRNLLDKFRVFVYTDKLPEEDSLLEDLQLFAEYYVIQELSERCQAGAEE